MDTTACRLEASRPLARSQAHLATLAGLVVVAGMAWLTPATAEAPAASTETIVIAQAGARDPYAPAPNTGRYAAPLPSDAAPSGRVEGGRWVPDARSNPSAYAGPSDRAPAPREAWRSGDPDEARRGARTYERAPQDDLYYEPRNGEAEAPPRDRGPYRYDRSRADVDPRYDRDLDRGRAYDRRADYDTRETYSENEIIDAGHRFFGSVSRGLARAVQSVMSESGPPNGYILGEDAGGAFVAGLRYGEGRLFTKRFGNRKVYWQGPSLGYDFGGEGSKVMVLVYNLRRPGDIFRRFGGVQGSAYVVGGVSVQFQKSEDIVLAPIRAGVGLRLGANVGYLKYTRRPTWNPF